MLEKLEAMSYLERQRDPGDERQVRISLTKSGRRLCEEVLKMDPDETGLAPDAFAHVQSAVVTLRNNLIKSVLSLCLRSPRFPDDRNGGVTHGVAPAVLRPHDNRLAMPHRPAQADVCTKVPPDLEADNSVTLLANVCRKV